MFVIKMWVEVKELIAFEMAVAAKVVESAKEKSINPVAVIKERKFFLVEKTDNFAAETLTGPGGIASTNPTIVPINKAINIIFLYPFLFMLILFNSV
jgi:hypothetical protein